MPAVIRANSIIDGKGVGSLKSGDARILPFAEYDDGAVLIGGLAKRWLDGNNLGVENCFASVAFELAFISPTVYLWP
jgi:hypothetical protein